MYSRRRRRFTDRNLLVPMPGTLPAGDNVVSSASGNIGMNVAAGTGNLQANSLALAVAQPSAAQLPGGGE
jgi:hypothetical protein